MKQWLTLLLALLLPCAALAEDVHIEQVEDLPEDFLMGMDVSSVLALEASGVTYRDEDGTQKDLFLILREHGVNAIRVRVWNDPYDSEGRGYGGGNCDIDTAGAIGQRATAQGMGLLVDFHYSDFWADPAKQMVPKAWAGMTLTQKADALYAYTCDSLTKLLHAGVNVTMVQIGNETNARFCGEGDWDSICVLMNAGCRAVRDTCPGARIALHFANPEQGNYLTWAGELQRHQVDYDVFASSYYPFWHGTLENLQTVLGAIRQSYGKDVMVAETSYAYTMEDSDYSANSVSSDASCVLPYPVTVQGQADALADVIRTVNAAGGIGVFYWEGAWITVGGASWAENHALWEKYGSGWASSHAGAYDPEDAGKYYGGSACDNQALFAPDGHALPSLRTFLLIRQVE